MSPLLQVSRLSAGYGRAQILFELDLEVRPGEAVALMGRNGAGKSTTLKAIMGVLPAWHGSIRFAGRDLTRESSFRRARQGLGWVPEDRRIFAELTVAENLEVGRQPPRADAPHWTIAQLFELFPNLAGMTGRPAGSMSGGEQQMLTLARTLMGNPRLVLLDEPSEGVAPVIVEQMAASINQMKRQGLAVLLSEQNLEFAGRICERAYVLEQGRICLSTTLEGLQADEAARRTYLGV